MSDANPLMNPPVIPPGPGMTRSPRAPALAVALGLLALAAAILTIAYPQPQIRRRLIMFRHKQATP